MKFILVALLSIPGYTFSQQIQLKISANNKSIIVSPGDDDNNKLFTIDTSLIKTDDFLIVHIITDETGKDWKRNFSVYDNAGVAIKDFTLMKDESYCIKVTGLTTLLQPQHDYFIYMLSIPKDPQKAMLVKAAKLLVCKIRIL